MAGEADSFSVEVAYARPREQVILEIKVAPGTTVEEAIHASGILARFPEIDLGVNKVGIFGRVTPLCAVVRERDRVEIYRPLLADPREIRRRRAAAGRPTRKGVAAAG